MEQRKTNAADLELPSEPTYRVEKYDRKTEEDKELQHLESPVEPTYRVDKYDPKSVEENEQKHLELHSERTYRVEKYDCKTEEDKEQQHLESPKPLKSVEITQCDGESTPSASEILREISEQKRKYDKLNKRLESLATWKWEEVINVSSSDHGASEDDQQPDDQMVDTADSMESFWKKSKIPRIEIRSRGRVVQVESV